MRARSKSFWITAGIVWPLLVALGLLPAAANAQSINVAAGTDALAQVAQFGNDVRAMRSVAITPMGPYDLSTRCTWCSEHAWWGFGTCTQNTTETWNAKVDFTWTRSRLNQILAQATQSANNFPAAYAPFQAWIKSIPAFSVRFDNAANIVLTTQQQIKAGQGPNDQQRQAVTQALQDLVNDLAANAAQLDNATKSLAAALQQQSAYGPAIKQAIDGADQSARTALAGLQQQANTHHCQDGLADKFSRIKVEFTTSIVQISALFQKLEASRQAADRGLAFLLGSVVSSRTDLQSVMDQIKAAKSDVLGSFLERLHLASAKAQWEQIAAYTTSRLSGSPGG
ncbi:MAG TPA: hypothetical protein VIZ17_06825 [Acetobacteraceae bacterium]